MADNFFKIGKGVTLTPQAAEPTGQNGDHYYNDALGKHRFYENGQWKGLGSGAGGINYIENPDAEANTDGWNLLNDADEGKPVDGTGGTASNTTFTRTTTNPLRETGSFYYENAAHVAPGQGVSTDFEIDLADQAKVLRISFDYEITGTFRYNATVLYVPETDPVPAVTLTQSDLTVWIYDVTNGVLIEPTATNLDGSGRFISEFQTNPNSTSYRLIIYQSVPNSSAFQVKFDNVQVGPREIAKNYTPNRSWQKILTSNVTTSTPDITDLSFTDLIIGKTYRVSMQGHVLSNGGDDVIFSASHDGNVIAAVKNENNQGTQDDGIIVGTQSAPFVATANSLQFGVSGISGSSSLEGDGTLNETFIVVEELNNHEGNPTVTQSTDFGSRVIAFRATNPDTSILPTSATFDSTTNLIFPSGSIDFDKTSSYNSSNGQYTAPETGIYELKIRTRINGTEATNNFLAANVYVNGVLQAGINERVQNSGLSRTEVGGSTLLEITAGDIITVRLETNVGSPSISSDSPRTHELSIHKIQSPQTLMGGEVVAARYSSDSGQSIPDGVETIINFEDKDVDTHSAVTIGASWKFTAPISGMYSYSATINIEVNNGFDEGEDWGIRAFKNGVRHLVSKSLMQASPVTFADQMSTTVTGTVYLAQGDTFDFRARQATAASRSLTTTTGFNAASIFKIN